MGHHNLLPRREHELLRKRYDRMVTGAPDSPHLLRILSLLYTPEEADWARRLPISPTSVDDLAQRLHIPPAQVNDIYGQEPIDS